MGVNLAQTIGHCQRGERERRDPKFGVRSSENLELRTLNPPPSRSSSLSRSSRIARVSPAPPVARATIVLPQPARVREAH